jgi:hypothetical protein
MLHITTKDERMKRALLISIPALLITGIISVASINHAADQYVAVPLSVPVANVADSKPLEAPQVQETATIAPVTVDPVQEAPTTPTNEDLMARYGFDSASMDYIMWMFPQHFTEPNREKAFAYLNSIVRTGKVVGTEPKTINSIAFVKWYFMQHYMQESWVNVGKLAEVDTSQYE